MPVINHALRAAPQAKRLCKRAAVSAIWIELRVCACERYTVGVLMVATRIQETVVTIVPIIDVSGLGGAIAERKSVAEKINSACEDIGFLCVTGHGIDPDLSERVRATATAFFDLPEAQKRQIERQPPGYRGYIPFGGVSLARSAGKMDAKPDLNEAFSMGPPSVPGSVDLSDPVAAANFALNRFPSDPAEMQQAFESIINRCRCWLRVCCRVLR